MKRFRFTPVGLLYIHPTGHDVVVHGDPSRTDVEVQAPRIPESAKVYPIEILDAESHIRISGPVTVLVPASSSIFVEGEASDVVVQQIAHAALDDCRSLIASQLTSLRCNGKVKGDVVLRKINQFAHLQRIEGTLAASDVTSLRTEDVRGDVSLTNVKQVQMAILKHDFSIAHAEDIQIKEIANNVRINNVSNAIAIKRVGGHLEVNSPGLTLAATEVLGNVQLNGTLQQNGKYWINAGGNVALRIEGDVRIAVRAGGEIMAGDEIAFVSEKDDLKTALIGEDVMAADLNIVAGGDVIVNSPAQWQQHRRAALDAEIQKTIKDVQGDILQALGKVSGQVQGIATAVAGDMPKHSEPMPLAPTIHQVVRDILSAIEPTAPPQSTKTESGKPVSDEIQFVLQMLEEGRITVEEADVVLEALGL